MRKVDCRIPSDEFQSSEYPFYDVVDLALDYVWDPSISMLEERQSRYSTLTNGLQVLLPVVQLDGDVCNGGFQQYFFNSFSDFAAEAMSGLERLGAKRHAALFANAMSLFPKSIVPRIREERWETLMDGDTSRLNKAKTANDEKSMIDAYWIHPRIASKLDKYTDTWYDLNESKSSLPDVLGPGFIKDHLTDFVR